MFEGHFQPPNNREQEDSLGRHLKLINLDLPHGREAFA
jgi:hypothetical protein